MRSDLHMSFENDENLIRLVEQTASQNLPLHRGYVGPVAGLLRKMQRQLQKAGPKGDMDDWA